MVLTESLPYPGIGLTHAGTTAEAAALTGSITGSAFGLVASLIGVTIPMQEPLVAMSPMLLTLAGAAIGAMVGGLIGIIANAALEFELKDYVAAGERTQINADDALFERVVAAMRVRDPPQFDVSTRSLRVANIASESLMPWR